MKRYLVEEHIFPIPTLSRKLFEVPILTNAVFLTKLLPELAPDYDPVNT